MHLESCRTTGTAPAVRLHPVVQRLVALAFSATLLIGSANAQDGTSGSLTAVEGSSTFDQVGSDDCPLSIELATDSGRGAFEAGGSSASEGGWNDTSRSVISWRMRTEKNFRVDVFVETSAGPRTFYYDEISGTDGRLSSQFIRIGMDEQNATDGQWTVIRRDLAADLAAVEPGNTLVALHGFSSRGERLEIDGLTLSGCPGTDCSTATGCEPEVAAAEPEIAPVTDPLTAPDPDTVTDPDAEVPNPFEVQPEPESPEPQAPTESDTDGVVDEPATPTDAPPLTDPSVDETDAVADGTDGTATDAAVDGTDGIVYCD